MLKLPSGLSFFYQKGRGVIIERKKDITDAEVLLFLNGSVYGAIIWINRLAALHASAIVHAGGVHAFTGVSGAGKSTLVAALGRNGLPMMADDVLVLDLSDPDAIWCQPGHKQIKLWNDAFALTGAAKGTKVRPDIAKFYAEPPAGLALTPQPLVSLTLIDCRSLHPAYTQITGKERFTAALASLYRPAFCNALLDKQSLFRMAARISQQTKMIQLDRAKNTAQFDTVTHLVLDRICGQASRPDGRVR
ncbi:hypothetical protein [Pontixanthobacter sp.]|uniref:hypothetical protein n=1 Tax=Pontixanthobacter sp. TaxID=2792078 RepID=UPI003C7A819B